MNISFDDAFALYKKTGSKANLSKKEFGKLWKAMDEDYQQWLIGELEKGEATLTKELLKICDDNVDLDDFVKDHPQVAFRVCEFVKKDKIDKLVDQFKLILGEINQQKEDEIRADLTVQLLCAGKHVAYIDSWVEKQGELRLHRELVLVDKSPRGFLISLRGLSVEQKRKIAIRFMLDMTTEFELSRVAKTAAAVAKIWPEAKDEKKKS